MWRQRRRDAVRVARCTVERLMREMGLRGVGRGRAWKITTQSDPATARATNVGWRESNQDSHRRARNISCKFADFTYVVTWRGFGLCGSS